MSELMTEKKRGRTPGTQTRPIIRRRTVGRASEDVSTMLCEKQYVHKARNIRNYTELSLGGARDRQVCTRIPLWVRIPAGVTPETVCWMWHDDGVQRIGTHPPEGSHAERLTIRVYEHNHTLSVAIPMAVYAAGHRIVEWRIPTGLGDVRGELRRAPRWEGAMPLPLPIQERLIAHGIADVPMVAREFIRRRLVKTDWTIENIRAVVAEVSRPARTRK